VGTPHTEGKIMEAVILVAGLVGFALYVWVFVLCVRFLSSGRKAFDAYTRTVTPERRTRMEVPPQQRPWEGRS
jgi:hypothetical protein